MHKRITVVVLFQINVLLNYLLPPSFSLSAESSGKCCKKNLWKNRPSHYTFLPTKNQENLLQNTYYLQKGSVYIKSYMILHIKVLCTDAGVSVPEFSRLRA
jgi:hypothetical protein